MAYWLLKSEPDVWSYADQAKKGAKGDAWTGVRNFQARKNLIAMKKGDRAFFYHTGDEKAVAGIVEVLRESYPDPTAKKDEPWVVVDVKAIEAMPKPVALEAIRKEPRLKDMVLVHNARLSVQPVTDSEWKLVCRMGGLKS
jgi:predicted RNA-binding protein with PUA-like domain